MSILSDQSLFQARLCPHLDLYLFGVKNDVNSIFYLRYKMLVSFSSSAVQECGSKASTLTIPLTLLFRCYSLRIHFEIERGTIQ